MKTTEAGQHAEHIVEKHFKKHGYKILGRNWRTKLCEIDIVATKDKVVYFIEVKYRRNEAQGSGSDYITPRKLKQMHFAAEIWNQNNGWDGDWRLMAASVNGEGADKLEIIEII